MVIRGKTPWENMKSESNGLLKNLNKSPRRLEREDRIESLMSNELKGKSLLIKKDLEGNWEKIFWWAWRIGVGIDIGLIFMVVYSKMQGWI